MTAENNENIVNVKLAPALVAGRQQFTDRHKDHDGGILYIRFDKAGPHKVTATPGVKAGIVRGSLIEVVEVKADQAEPADDGIKASDAAIEYAAEHGVDLVEVVGTGAGGNIKKGDVVDFVKAQDDDPDAGQDDDPDAGQGN